MRLYAYIVAFDGGFAPCVSRSLCTLACCKPRIRAKAAYGDWMAGTTRKEHGSGRLIYLMRVERAFTFREYYERRGFRNRNDNIYQPQSDGGYRQRENGSHGPQSIRKDLSADRVLCSDTFVYFGENAPEIPSQFEEFVPKGRGHKVHGSGPGEPPDRAMGKKIKKFVRWALANGHGVEGRPFDTPHYHHNC